MAIRRVKRKKPWQVYWNNPFTARRETVQFQTETEAKAHDSLIRHRLKYDRDYFKPEVAPPVLGKTMTVEELLYAHLAYKRPSKANAERVISDLRPVAALLGNISVTDLAKHQIMQAMNEQLLKVKPKTVRIRFAHLKAAYSWAVEQGILNSVPQFRLPQASSERIPPPSNDECISIINNALQHVQRVVVLGIYCGMRIGSSELFKLTWQDVDLKSRILRVWSAEKNKKIPWRDVPLCNAVFSEMEKWYAEDNGEGYIIHWKGKPVKSIKKAWDKALKKAGITRRIRPYDLRHAFATNALEAGADLKSVSEIMGHADTTMVLKTYQHVKASQHKKTVDSLPDIF